jgi:hypothetical protein
MLVNGTTWKEWVKQLKEQFGFEHVRNQYLKKLREVKFGSSVVQYLTQIRLLNDVVGYDDKSLRDIVEAALPYRIVSALAANPREETFEQWLLRVQTLGLALEQVDREHPRSKPNDKGKGKESKGTSSDKVSKTRFQKKGKGGKPTTAKPNSSDKDKNWNPFGVTHAEREWAKKKGKCLRCLGSGHLSNACTETKKASVQIDSIEEKTPAKRKWPDKKDQANKKVKQEVATVARITELADDEEGFGPEV